MRNNASSNLALETNLKVIMSPDKNVEAIREKFLQRSIVGLKKYGVTTERTDLEVEQWLRHLQEELMDAVIYIEATLNKKNDQKVP